jgi:hypothetical protein
MAILAVVLQSHAVLLLWVEINEEEAWLFKAKE